MKKFIFLLLIAFYSCNDTKELTSQTTKHEDPQMLFTTWLSNQKLPEKMDFCGEKIPLEIPEVKERAEREFYVNLQQPGQLILYIKRAGKYFETFEKIIRENNMPDDLKFLSVAESALYMSKSPKDAVGLWQFIPETGKRMGLTIDDYVDERRHHEKSTQAAMKYLKQGYDTYKSWLLSAAGYNMGHHNVTDNVQFQNSENFFDLFLNEETSRYILRIVIIKELMKNPSKYGLNLKKEDIYTVEKTKTVTVETGVPNLSEWAKLQGTTYKDVKLLNPWILQRKLPAPQKGKVYEISIPAK